MDDIAEHHHIIRYHFHEGPYAAETVRRICEVYGPNVLKERVVRKSLRLSVSETLVLKKRSGRPRHGQSHNFGCKPIWPSEKSRKFLVCRTSETPVMWAEWMCGYRHKQSDRNLQQRLDVCDLLLEKNKKHLFFKKMIMKSGFFTNT